MVDTSWELEDDTTVYTVDGLLAQTVPDIVVGEEVTLTFHVSSGSQNRDDFDALTSYAEFINDQSTDFGTTFEGEPWYRFSTYPGTNISSFVFEVRPTPRLPEAYNFWGLLTEAEDVSRITTSGGRIEMTFFVLAEASDYTRTELENNLKADL